MQRCDQWKAEAMSEFKIEDTYTLEACRREFRYYCDLSYGLLHALRDLPEMPNAFILMHLGSAAKYPEDWNKGKELQNKLGLDTIPPKTECEMGAGLWFRLRTANATKL